MGVAIVVDIAAVTLAYMAIYVPVLGPKLTRAESNQHWLAAVVVAAIVTAVGIFVARAALSSRRLSEAIAGGRDTTAPTDEAPLTRIPRSLRLERVPVVWAKRAAAVSLATTPLTIGLGAPLWAIWLAILAPWAPIVVLESRSRLAYNVIFASFGMMVVLQVLHMVEHTTQVVQLAITGGVAEKAHGVIGQLDFETVHFVADSALWIGLGLMLIALRARNAWLWVAFVAASLHEIEHLYLFWLYAAEHTVYLSGGAAGIMGHYGLIGTPLDRPYLHYAYNFVVFVPLLLAFWDEARYVDRTRLRAKRT
ncbi:MAG: hypothetical protein ACRDMZ_05395 [Solirubrobacteraceae bacterium]